MTVAKLVPVLEAATAGGYGVLAVNIVNGLTLRAVVDAAEELRAPVIVQTSVKTVLSQGIPRPCPCIATPPSARPCRWCSI